MHPRDTTIVEAWLFPFFQTLQNLWIFFAKFCIFYEKVGHAFAKQLQHFFLQHVAHFSKTHIHVQNFFLNAVNCFGKTL